ncbi:peptidase C14, caspase catalytic subunit p20 [Oscillochloris trichoides DG-6]|uniref:Peptidase C14, caspase catalytic subunit p20 n=1 Tax=Oscillochloris trichoides DG-6 TaxID=765420 RepID=E1IEM1_9CHLR|nr:caspase family protein [Oscillochloris trichoides]EFO80362.1 peptidase C14, caspase catalytic subunit p20 [Oscillochloris trichoides DG-6]
MPFSTAHALVIGVGTYAHTPRFNVAITATDATSVATVLRDPQLCGYPPAQVALLSHAAASRAGIMAALDALARVGTDDTVFIFYAGHGAYGDDGYYLTTHDTRMDGKKVVVGTGLREAELIAKLRAIPAKRLVLILNACHAGAISPVLAAEEAAPTGTPMPPPVAAALLGTGEGRVIISACRENQYAFIGPGPLTLFTQALVDGLQGKGIASNHGYISIFDLYTHLYFTLEETVTRQIPAATRKHYGEKQEPELTILKGVGPFAVALYRGTSTLGTFAASSPPPAGTAVREVNPAYSQAMLRQHQQHISGNAQVGAAIAGDVHGNVNVDQRSQHGGVRFGDGGQYGDISIGDVVGGDKITTGDISGTEIAIGRGAQSSVRHISTGGGDYAEGSIDKRRGTFVSGDQFTMSGNFSGALLNIKSTLSNVTQSIAAAPHADATTKAQLQTLVEQLSTELQRVPATHAAAAEQTAKRVEQSIAEASKPHPDREDVAYSLKRLAQAAEQIAQVLPSVLPISIQIGEVVRRMIGG